MPYIDAIAFVKWVKNADQHNVPDAVAEIHAWSAANAEQLPDGTFGVYEDVTGQAGGPALNQRILDNLGLFLARLQMTVATAQHFAADPRIWTLGYWRRDDDAAVLSHNWNTTLTAAERQQAVNYVTSNSNITAQQIAAVFDATDTRAEIADKLKAYFRQ